MPRLQCMRGFLLGLFAALPVQAADNFIVGVGTHLLDSSLAPESPVQLMSDAGIVSARDDLFWSTVEAQPGQLSVPGRWQRYLQTLRERALGNVLILGYGNSFYDNTAKPVTPMVRQGFARYVDFISQRLQGQVDYYEIWNEWDVQQPAHQASSDAYALLIADTAAQLRRNDPAAKLLAGAVTSQGIDEGFPERLIQAGVMSHLDGLSLHPYVHCRKDMDGNTPENWMKWLNATSMRLNKLAGREVPLYLTEMSWPSSDEPCGVSESTQAAYLARSFFLARSHPDIHGMWWYDLFNDGRDPQDREHNFGLLDNDLQPKQAYATLKAIAPYLSQYRFEPAHSSFNDSLYQLRFSRDDQQVLVTWAVGKARQVRVESSAPLPGRVRVLDTRWPQQGMQDSETVWNCDTHACTAVITAARFPKIVELGEANWLFTR